MNSLGLVLNNVASSQASFFGISFINAWIAQGHDYPATIFTQNVANPCMPINTAVMEMSNLLTFRGNIVCTTVHQADQVLQMANPSPKYLYLWESRS